MANLLRTSRKNIVTYVYNIIKETMNKTKLKETCINPSDTIGDSTTPSPPWLKFGLRGPLRIILSPEMRFQKGRKVDWSQKMAICSCPK